MNHEECLKWEEDARAALLRIYSSEETEKILDWFRRIKGSNERDLIGDQAVEAMLVFVSVRGRKDRPFSFGARDLYNSLMARLFIYAPFILEEI